MLARLRWNTPGYASHSALKRKAYRIATVGGGPFSSYATTWNAGTSNFANCASG